MTAADATSTTPPEQAERVTLTKDHDAHIARITICNPAKKNAMAPEDCELMGRHLDDIAEDDAIKVVIVRGEGGVFTTGVDLNRAYGWYATPGDDRRPSQRRRLAVDRKGQRMFHEFIGFPKATIVQVESYALGLGLELALAADLAVVSRQAKLGMPAARFLGPVLGNVALFMHRLGPVVARDLMLTGRMATGAEFESAKLFTRFVDEARRRGRNRGAGSASREDARGRHRHRQRRPTASSRRVPRWGSRNPRRTCSTATARTCGSNRTSSTS